LAGFAGQGFFVQFSARVVLLFDPQKIANKSKQTSPI
jgi:hypothetical protein